MANLEGMPIGSLPEATDIQDEDEIVVYRPSTGKAYQANTDLIDSLSDPDVVNLELNDGYSYQYTASRPKMFKFGNLIVIQGLLTISSATDANICTIPEGYRPGGGYNRYRCALDNANALTLNINSSGVMSILGTISGTFLCLNGIVYMAEN